MLKNPNFERLNREGGDGPHSSPQKKKDKRNWQEMAEEPGVTEANQEQTFQVGESDKLF